MSLIELLSRRQKMNGDTFGKTLFGVYFYSEIAEKESPTKQYVLRKFMRALYAAYLHPAP